jgi:hypothetical protein
MHTIRLRHPWTLTIVEPTKPRQLTFTRKFNLPSGLNNSRVLLAISPLESRCVLQHIHINDQPLSDTILMQTSDSAPPQARVADITDALTPFNQLQVQLDLPADVATDRANDNAPARFDELATAELRIVEDADEQ